MSSVAPSAAEKPGPRTFTDGDGRLWTVRVGVREKSLMAALGFRLEELLEPKSGAFEKIATDLELQVSCLFAVVEPQALRHGVTPEEFASALFGDALERGGLALLDACVDFFPDAAARGALRKLIETGLQVARKASTLAQARLEKALAGVDVDSAAATLIGLSGNAPGSSAPTPPRSRSRSSSK